MYDTLLALHLLSAAVAFITVMFFSVWAFGLPVTIAHFRLADVAWNVSGGGLLVFGIWLALDVDGYGLLDGWILGSIVLLVVASFFGARARQPSLALATGGEPAALAGRVATWHWLRTATVVAILILMIFKPGA